MTKEEIETLRVPHIVWENYGYEGWRPRGFQTLTEIMLDENRYGNAFVITKCVNISVSEHE